jgi:hypothetical protein
MFDPVVKLLEFPGSDQVHTRTRADEQAELPGETAHLEDRLLAVDRDQGIDVVAVAGDDARNEAVGDALDQVPSHLATHQRARLVRFDRDDMAPRIDRAKCLPDTDNGAAGPHPANDGVGHNAGRQLSKHLRPQRSGHQTIVASVPLAEVEDARPLATALTPRRGAERGTSAPSLSARGGRSQCRVGHAPTLCDITHG